ncbi:MAG: Set3 complex subunit with deacetylase activity, meiotic-specific repressor of sporulation proteins [Candelina mexicana]|nr:MAG: Set3 complex subunit with deacetylase activity, meiotic-specific repressor of sporulation proteins [Candelina mexicana]
MSSHDGEGPSSAKPTDAENRVDNQQNADKDVVPMDNGTSSPSVIKNNASEGPSLPTDDAVDDDSSRGDSEAETVVLSGTDGSPEKKKRSIKHEDKGDSERLEDVVGEPTGHATLQHEERSSGEEQKQWKDTGSGKRKRGSYESSRGAVHAGGQLSGLSSVSPSPVAVALFAKNQDSNSNPPRSSPPPVPSREKIDKNSRKRKLAEETSTAEDESHRKSRQRPNSEASSITKSDRRDTRSATHGSNQQTSHDRSPSPRSRSHKRAVSTQSTLPQLPNGQSHKKKKVPPPLVTTRNGNSSDDSHSDSSSASGDAHSHPHLRRLTSMDIAMMSPAKMPHKKHRDQIGRTFLARACASMEVENARTRLCERPEDIDLADNAGNTPLQIASLEGSAEIVRILIDAGCDIHCKNNEKDTPLIDAVENGHLEVVQLLLDAGANPRQGNVNGVEPEDLLNSEDENYEAIKHALSIAKNRTDHRRPSEDHHTQTAAPVKEGGRSSRGGSAASPRGSPPMVISRSPPVGNPPRRRTVRSEATRNDLLWMRPTLDNLRELAGKGDMAGVGHILSQVPKADTESLIAAARGGHDEVIQLLLGIGGADADPSPLHSPAYKAGYNTPMLAAIGRGNEKVLQLLLAQPKFNPTRRPYRGLTYFEIAEERQNSNWEKEYGVLKGAFDKYVAKGGKPCNEVSSKASASASSPRKHEHKEKDTKQQIRTGSSSSADLSAGKKSVKSLGPGGRETGSDILKRDSIPTEVSRDNSNRPSTTMPSPKSDTQPSHHGKDSSEPLSDHELTPLGLPKGKLSVKKRRKSDAGAITSEGEVNKRRRKLISGKLLRTDKEKKRRASVNSSASSSSGKDKSARTEPEVAEKTDIKQSPRTNPATKPKIEKATVPRLRASTSESDLPFEGSLNIKNTKTREDFPNRLGVVREEAGPKRARNSVSPQRSRSREAESYVSNTGDSKKKRRRIELSSDPSHETASGHQPTPGPARVANMDRSAEIATSNRGSILQSVVPHEPKPTSTDRTKKAKKTSVEANATQQDSTPGAREASEREQASIGISERDAQADASIKALLRKQREARRNEEEARKRAKEETEKRIREEEEHEEQVQREQAEEQARLMRQAEEERRAADKAERERQAQAEKEEYERKERIAREEEEIRLEQKRMAEEAERRRMLALQEEEARKERKRREEELQRRRAEQERLRREEQERRRAEREEFERQQRIERQEEEERKRRQALPNSLRRTAELDAMEAKTLAEARKWLPLYSVPTKELDPNCDGDVADERWVANFQVAPILGIKDLQLSQYTAWEKRQFTDRQRTCIWRVTRRILSEAIKPTPLTNISYKSLREMDVETEAKFFAMDHVFWIKYSDFKDIVPRFPHLAGLPLRMREAHVDYIDRPSGAASGISVNRTLSLPLPNASSNLENGITTNSVAINGTISHSLIEPNNVSPTNNVAFQNH